MRPPSIRTARSASGAARSSRCSASSTVVPRSALRRPTAAKHVFGALRVELRRRLVEHERVGRGRERAGDRGALALAAGERRPGCGRAGARCRARRAPPPPAGASRRRAGRGSRARTQRRPRPGRRRTAPPGPGARSRRRPRARAACACASSGPNAMTSPANRPPVECGTRPFAARSSVLLPEPDEPTTSRISPACTSRSTCVERERAVRVAEGDAPVVERRAHAPVTGSGRSSGSGVRRSRRGRGGRRRGVRISGASSGTSASATSGWNVGQCSGLVCQTSESSPARPNTPRSSGVSSDARDHHPVGRRHAAVAVAAPVPRPSRTRTSPRAIRNAIPTSPSPIAAGRGASDRARRTRPRARAARRARTSPRRGRRACCSRNRTRARPWTRRARPRVPCPRSSTGTMLRRIRPRRIEPAAGAGAVGLAHRADRLDRRRDERERDRRDHTELVERARRRLHELVVRHDRVERAEHGQHPDEGEALGQCLQDDARPRRFRRP